MKEHRGWNRRRSVPHYDEANTIQFITYRLVNSLPPHLLNQENAKLKLRRLDKLLDENSDGGILTDPRLGQIVLEHWRENSGIRYDLAAWSIMPNHVHVLISLIEGNPLGDIMRRQKSKSAIGCNRVTGRTGRFWQRGYWDVAMRGSSHLENTVKYILDNRLKVGLANKGENMTWGGIDGNVIEGLI